MTTASGRSSSSLMMYCQHRPSQSSSWTLPDHPQRAVALEAQFLDDAAAVDDGGQRAFHVAGAAAVDDAVPFVALERIHRPVGRVADVHGVDVGVEGDDARAVADAAEDVAHAVDADFVVAALEHLALDAADDVAFLRADRLDGDEVAEETHDVSFVRAGVLEDRLGHREQYKRLGARG